MATINISVDADWTLIVPTAATWCLVSSDSPSIVEYATGANDSTAPTATIGWRLKQNEGFTRAVIQEGSIYARVANQASSKTAVVVVDADSLPS